MSLNLCCKCEQCNALRKQGRISELDEIEKRFKKISKLTGFATPKLAIEYVGFVIKKRREELRKGGKTQ